MENHYFLWWKGILNMVNDTSWHLWSWWVTQWLHTWPVSSNAMTTTAAPCFLMMRALARKSSSPSLRLMLFTMHLPWLHLRPASITWNLEESIHRGTCIGVRNGLDYSLITGSEDLTLCSMSWTLGISMRKPDSIFWHKHWCNVQWA